MANDYLTFDGLLFYDTKLKLWVQTNRYTLPEATTSSLGGIKVGTGLKILSDGTLSVDGVELTWDAISDKPQFKPVATSGSYADLINTPTIPTLLSQLANDPGYQNAAQVAAAVAGASFLKVEKVAVLPPIGSAKINTIYMVPMAPPADENIYEEWLLLDGAWEFIGTTSIDLSGYWSKAELIAVTNAQIDSLFA